MYTCVQRVKFNGADNVISLPFVYGTVLVHQRTWWYALIDFRSSLSSKIRYYNHFLHMQIVRMTYTCYLLLMTTLGYMFPLYKIIA